MQLNVLPRREVGIAVPKHGTVVRSLGKRIGSNADLSHLGCCQDATGHLDPHHEGVAALALGVHSNPLEALLLSRHLVDGRCALLGVGVDDRLGHLKRVPGQFQLLNGVELADVAVRPDEFEPAVTSAPEFHPIGVVQIARH